MLIYESMTVPQDTTASQERIQRSWACCEDGSAFVLPGATREKTRGSPVSARWGPCPLQHLKRSPRFRLEVRNGTWHPWCNQKSYPTFTQGSEVKFCEQIKILSLYNRELKLLPWNQKVVFPSETHFKNKFLPEMCHSFQSSMVEIDHTKTQSQLVC